MLSRTNSLFVALKWWALARGIWRGLTYRKRGQTASAFDRVLKSVYLDAMREALDTPLFLNWSEPSL